MAENEILNNDTVISNFSTTLSYYDLRPPVILEGISIIASAIGIGLFINQIFGNILTLVALLTVKKLRTYPNMLLVSLILNVILFYSTTFPVQLYTLLYGSWPFVHTVEMCWFLNLSYVTFLSNTAMHAPVIALHRYLIVVHPILKVKLKLMFKKAMLINLFIIHGSTLFAQVIPRLLLMADAEKRHQMYFSVKLMNCVHKDVVGYSRNIAIIGNLMVCCVFAFCYFRIYFVVRKDRNRIQDSFSVAARVRRNQKELKILQSLLIIIAIYMAGAVSVPILMHFDPDFELSHKYYIFGTVLVWVNLSMVWGVLVASYNDLYEACRNVLFKGRNEEPTA